MKGMATCMHAWGRAGCCCVGRPSQPPLVNFVLERAVPPSLRLERANEQIQHINYLNTEYAKQVRTQMATITELKARLADHESALSSLRLQLGDRLGESIWVCVLRMFVCTRDCACLCLVVLLRCCMSERACLRVCSNGFACFIHS